MTWSPTEYIVFICCHPPIFYCRQKFRRLGMTLPPELVARNVVCEVLLFLRMGCVKVEMFFLHPFPFNISSSYKGHYEAEVTIDTLSSGERTWF